MNNIFKALNVKNQEEMDNLIESFDLNDKQYITFYSALNNDMSPEGLRFMLENITKEFYNGSYEKLVEQYKKPTQERVLKEMPMNDEQYKKLKVGDKVKFDKPCQAPQPEEYDEIIDKTDDEIKTKFRHHGGKARTICKWKPEHFKKVYSVKEYTEVVEPKHKIGDRIVTMNKIYGWPYAGSKIVDIIPPSWQDGDEAHYSYVIKGIEMDKDIGKPVLTKATETVPVETIDTINEDTVYDHSWYEVKKQKYPKRTKEGVIIKENMEKLDQKVLNELYDIISDQMGKMYMSNYDEVDFDNLLDSVDDFGREIDGYNPALKADYAQALKTKWEEDTNEFKNDYILDLTSGIFEGDTNKEPDTLDEAGKPVKGSNVAYKVELICCSKYYSEICKEQIAMTLKEAKQLAQKFLKRYLRSRYFYMATVEKGRTNWGVRADEFDGNEYIVTYTNKDIATAEDILGNDAPYYGDIIPMNKGLTEAKDVLDEPDVIEEPLEDESKETKSSKDPKLQAEIEQMNQIVDTTNNQEVLGNLLQQVEAKLPLAQDTEQMNKLSELKQKIETKMQTGVSINEAYNPDEEEWFDIGDQVCFQWGGKNISGTVKNVREIGGNRYYQIASYNNEDGKVHNYIDIDPIGNEMKRCSETIDVEYTEMKENCSGTCAGNIAPVGKPMGKVVKRKKKKMVDEIENHLFKEYVLNDVPCEVELNGHKMKFFENEGKWYMSVDNALVKTFDKNVMMETADEINYEEPITADLLEGYSCYEMNILMEDGDNNLDVENNDNDTNEIVNVLSANKSSVSSADKEEIKKQNIQTAKDMNLKNKGQNVNLIDPDTSLEKDVKFIDANEEDGIGYIQDEKGDVSEVPMNLLKVKG